MRGFIDAHGGPLGTVLWCGLLALVLGVSWAQRPYSAEPAEWGPAHTVFAAFIGAVCGANLPMQAYISAAGFMAWPMRLLGAVVAPLMLGEVTRRFWLTTPWPAVGIAADVIVVAATAVDYLLIRRLRRARSCGCRDGGGERPRSRGCGCGESPR